MLGFYGWCLVPESAKLSWIACDDRYFESDRFYVLKTTWIMIMRDYIYTYGWSLPFYYFIMGQPWIILDSLSYSVLSWAELLWMCQVFFPSAKHPHFIYSTPSWFLGLFLSWWSTVVKCVWTNTYIVCHL